jgi:hypothetical protein
MRHGNLHACHTEVFFIVCRKFDYSVPRDEMSKGFTETTDEQNWRLIQDAANNGKRFNDVTVFAERSELIKKYCG